MHATFAWRAVRMLSELGELVELGKHRAPSTELWLQVTAVTLAAETKNAENMLLDQQRGSFAVARGPQPRCAPRYKRWVWDACDFE